jgi:hypothetical protein
MRHPYITTTRITHLERTLTARDWLIVATVARVRLATAGQLQRICFADVSRRQARQTLASLTDRRVLARLPRAVGGVRAGSAGFVYGLDVAGQRLAHQDGNRRRQRPWSVGMTFLAHTLAISELYAQLVEADRAGALELADFATEPNCWRSFTGVGGARTVLKPDAFVSTRLGRFEDSWFIEVDRGTESTTTLTRKCDRYRHYWQSGAEQARTGVFPKVLWLVPDERRYAALINVFGRQPAESWQLHAVALANEAVKRITQGAQV